jgi:hypothetical protein
MDDGGLVYKTTGKDAGGGTAGGRGRNGVGEPQVTAEQCGCEIMDDSDNAQLDDRAVVVLRYHR